MQYMPAFTIFWISTSGKQSNLLTFVVVSYNAFVCDEKKNIYFRAWRMHSIPNDCTRIE